MMTSPRGPFLTGGTTGFAWLGTAVDSAMQPLSGSVFISNQLDFSVFFRLWAKSKVLK
jgi:hypothetical protein